ncbi:alpha-L-arabinofuranosidase B-like protein [Actinocorallia herbida]|uniref:Alpha-L-arabinofuranosidase B-like protein n=1 Tax=Actinocorallia herbida TaxID=58109 RepID=A0A3N1D0D8_9ACTN|nr:AbfB domain-containing protein [Actinocorallia herbida]ROO86987.1 alpha-L-arabinofuranosidase B-like protein [Actinocorallia herbida]
MGTSFQSFNFPDRFIRHANFQGELTPIASELDRHDATFAIVRGLADPDLISIQSRNFPIHYLRHQGFRIRLHEGPVGALGVPPPETDEMKLMRKDATFEMVPGLADPASASFRSFNFPDRFLRHRDFHLFLDPVNDELSRKDATFKVVDGFIPDDPIH